MLLARSELPTTKQSEQPAGEQQLKDQILPHGERWRMKNKAKKELHKCDLDLYQYGFFEG